MNTIPLQKQTAFKYCTLLLMAVLMLFSSVKAQISVSGGNGLSATYTTFTTSGTGLFAALNASSQAGQVITVTVTGNVTEPATGVALTGAAGMWDLLSISPSGGAARTISGASTTDLFDFSGAQNVIIDGLNTGGNSLTITNTTAGSASTIRFINDAKSIKIRNCTIAGSANASQRAVVLFGTGVATGNDNIRISGCDIGAAGTNYPTNCVFSLGTSLAIDNSSDTLDNNTIHDFYSNTLPSFGIHLNNTNVSSSSSWFVNSNKIYQTVSRTYATANTHQLIALGTGAGHVCSNNTLGFGSSNGTGLFTVTSGTGTTRFVGISVTNSDLTGTPISVQGNTISGFSITSANTNATTSPTFAGIHITAGNANIGTVTGNTIGATTGTGSIAIITTASNGGAIGILMASTGTVNISNNNVGSISVTSATATNALGLYGIYGSAVSASLTVSNNTIGNSTASNMVAGTLGTTTGTTSVGGFIAGSVPTALTVNGNTIRNLISNSSGTSTFVRGIASGTSGTTTSVNIYNNTVRD
ncbi:MAG: beta strand repeat-containing protein, partial [Dolichospermum sp.]